MSSSLARTRSLRKPTQGSSTDLPPTTTTTTSASSASTTAAARGPASSTAGGGGAAAAAPSASASTSHRPVSPSRLPAPRSLAATRPTTRTVSGASVAGSTAATTASEAPKKKRPNPLSSLLSRSSSTRQLASATTTSTRQRDATATAGGGGSTSSGPTSAPLSRTSALSGLTRTSSTREPGLTRTRYPANASTSNLSLVSSSNTAAARAGAGSGPSTPTTARPTTSGGLPASRRAAAPGATSTSTSTATATGAAGSPTKGHARARSVATLNNSTILRPPSSTGAVAAPRSRPTSLYGAPPASSYPSSSASTTTARPRPPSATDRLSSKPSVSSLSSATTTTSTRTARAGSITTAPSRQPPKQSQPPHLARQQAQQRHPSPTSPPRTTKPSVLRPAFSTLQQHYSPAKSLAPKPLTATYLAAPSPSKLPANVALTAETSRLQTELLQLHLLHRDLPQVTSQWHASARSKLAARHADLARSARDLAALESDAAERRNLAALRNWATTPTSSSAGGGKISSLPLEDRIQRLDALLTSLWSLDSPGGKHHRLVRAFERWASTLSDLEAARARAQDSADPSALLDDNADVRFGGGLDARWKDDAAALVRRLEGWDAQLRELEYRGDDDGGENDGDAAVGTTTQASSLKRMLDGCGSLVRDMLDELAVMEDIEAAAVERENEWIKRMNREGDDGRGRDTQRAGAIWRVI